MVDDGERCELLPADPTVVGEWDELATAVRAPLTARAGWFSAWTAAFAGGRRLHVLRATRDGRVVGILPLVPAVRGARAPVNAETPAFVPVCLDAAAARTLGRGLRAAGHGVHLGFLPEGAGVDDLVAGARETGAAVVRRTQRSSPFVHVDGDWDAYQARHLSTGRRRDLRRSERRLQAAGTLVLDTRDGSHDLEALLSEGFALEAAGWKGRTGTAVLSRRSTRDFYWSLAEWARNRDALRLHFLRLDGAAVAFSFNLEHDGTVSGAKTAFSEEHRSLSPGVVLTHRLLGAAFATPGTTSFEFLGEADPYKLAFATGVRVQEQVRLYRATVRGGLLRGVDTATDRSRRQVRDRLPPELRGRVAGWVGAVRAGRVPGSSRR